MSRKQILSILLCAVMTCTLIPLTACRRSKTDMNSSTSSNTSFKDDSSELAESTAIPIDEQSSSPINSASDKTPSSKKTNTNANSAANYANVAVAVTKNLPYLAAEDTEILNNNPDRGFRLEISYDVQYISTAEDPASEIQKVLDAALKKASPEKITIAQVYLYLTGYHTGKISEKGLNCIQTVFDVYRKNHMSMLLRFAYQDDIGLGGDTTEHIYNYINQVAPVVQKNKDIIYAYQAGFVGAWGEWHSESPSVDREGIMNAIVNNLISDDMYMMVRLPNYKNYVSSSNPRYNRIGFHNDCFFGKRETSSLGGGGIDPGTAQWNQTMKESPYTPNDCELYWNDDLTNRGLFVEGLPSIQMISEHHFTSMSVLHSYKDAKGSERTSMGDWKKTAVTKDWLRQNGIVYSDSWFTSKNGSTVARNAFEYIRDYMGYRIEAQNVKVKGNSQPGATITVNMPIVNYGTGAAFNMVSGFAILDSNNNVVSKVNAGTPEKWYCTDPTNYNNRALLTHNIAAQLKLPTTCGQYKLAFFFNNHNGDAARLANDIPYVNGYNILHEFAY